MAIAQDLPYNNALFSVDIPSLPESQAFDEVLLPELLVEAVELREGNDRTRASRKFPGLTRYTNLVLRRGFSGRLDLYQWWRLAADNDTNARQTVSVHLLNDERTVVTSWRLSGAFPVRYTFAPLNGLDGSPLVETLEVSCDSVEME